MKRFFLLLLGLTGSLTLTGQTYAPIPLTGFTADIVANGSGSASVSSTHDVDGAQFTFMAQNFVNPSSQSPTSALPNSGLINSAATSGLMFQLAPYTGNNSLRISGTGSGTLTFGSPRLADQVYVLATSGSGTSTVATTITFTDGTTQVFNQSVSDWYNGSGFAIQGISRVNRTNNNIENSATNPRLYQYLLPVSAGNIGKSVQSVSFNKTSAGGVLNVMGISIRAIASTIAADAGVSAILSPVSGCNLSAQETITVTITNYGSATQSNIPVSYTLNNGTPVTEIFAGPLTSNATANYSFTAKANLSATGSYNLVAATNLSGDGQATNDSFSKTVTVSAAPNAPTITVSGSPAICPGTTAILSASGVAGASYQWYKDGAILNGATSASYAASVAGTYTAVAHVNGCTSTVSGSISITLNASPATPVVTASGSTAICSGNSVTLTASSATSGVTYSWLLDGTTISGANSATYTTSVPGRYAAMAQAGGCSSPASGGITVTVSATPVKPAISQSGPLLTSSSGVGNQWFLNGSVIPGATNRTLTATTTGAYTVMVTNNNCSSAASDPVNMVINGLQATEKEFKVQVFPNPTTGQFYVVVPEAKKYELEIYDLTGRKFKSQLLTEKETLLNLDKAAKGVYLLKLKDENNITTRKVFVE